MRPINEIRATRAAYLKSHDHPAAFACCSAHASADDVPGLLELVECLAADNERLSAERAAIRKATAQEIAQRIDDMLRDRCTGPATQNMVDGIAFELGCILGEYAKEA